ncbi:MAG: GIY-YIG nuclease family protein [Pseudomonadota bacterium]|nr:GIY-YIG nuclease family protein [Pseudomonadota bacterium]
MQKGGWVYIMASRYRGGMYVGVTSDLIRRVWQHREGEGSIHVADFKAACAKSEAPVIPAKAGTQSKQENRDAWRLPFQKCWVPASAGMTIQVYSVLL